MLEKDAQKRWKNRTVVASFALLIAGFFGVAQASAMEVKQDVAVSPVTRATVPAASATPAVAQQETATIMANLKASPKLHLPGKVLADFADGKSETAVIVLLRPTAAATALAAGSRAAQIPAEFATATAPTYYNLQDESIKTRLGATVTETVGRVVDELGGTGIAVTQRFTYQFGFAARVTPEALGRIVNSPDVLKVENDGLLYPHLAQGIPLMNATVPRSTYTGAGVSIAICDTGIDTSHPRLGGTSYFPNAKVIGGYNTGDNTSDPRPDPVSGFTHGTECAGIAAGDTGTVGDYIGGVAPGAKLYAIKISIGATGSATNSAMIAGWEWAVTHKNDDPNNPIMIISSSFGGGRFTATCDDQSTAMTTAAANAVAAGITIFASSGNDGYCDSMGWPACISYVNSVGAVYDASFGAYYPCINVDSCAPTKKSTNGCSSGWYATDSSSADKVTSYSNSAPFLTMFAPANMAYTTTIVGLGDAPDPDFAMHFGGTSAACPYAAGSAAVLQQAAKAKTGSFLTPAQVKTYLVNYGDPITDSKATVTKPRVNLGNAVDAISTPGGDGQITVTNGSSSYSITALYVASHTAATWGANRLASAVTAGGVFILTGVSPNTYDLMAVFSNGTSYTTTSVTVTTGATAQIMATLPVTTGQVKVTNGSKYYAITEMYIQLSTVNKWGPNQLDSELSTRRAITFINVPTGTYDTTVVFSNGTTATGSFTVYPRKTAKLKLTTPDPGKLKVMNFSKTYSIDELYISISTTGPKNWGPNRLPSPLPPRWSVWGYSLAGTYDVKAVFSNGSVKTFFSKTVAPRKTTVIKAYP